MSSLTQEEAVDIARLFTLASGGFAATVWSVVLGVWAVAHG